MLFYGLIFDLFVLSEDLEFKAYVLFGEFEHAYLRYVRFPNISQPSEIIVSCSGWASFGGLRQTYRMLPGGDFPNEKVSGKTQIYGIFWLV